MITVICEQPGVEPISHSLSSGECSIGSGRKNDIVISCKTVSKTHAVIDITDDEIVINDMGSMTGTWVNEERIVTYGPLSDQDSIVIGSTRVSVLRANGKNKPSIDSGGQESSQQQPPVAVEAKVAKEPPKADSGASAKADAKQGVGQVSPKKTVIDEKMLYWRGFIHERILQHMDLRRKDVHRMADDQVLRETEAIIDEVLAKHKKDIPASIDQTVLRTDVLNEAVGLGPLEVLLADDDVTEIMVNSHDQIFVEKKGQLTLSESTFTNNNATLQVIERIITPLGRRIDESSPMVDARLKDGSRVNAIIPPLAIKGPSITIRKFAKTRLEFEHLQAYGSISQDMVDFLKICVVHHKNIVVSGGTGSGKTTLLNVLSNLIPEDERIVTAEDAAELQLNQPNLVSLESRPPNLEGKGEIAIRDLVKNALRMRPDRIVVGECRGGEALDMLQAMNTGHDGSLTTAHANSPRDMLSRLEVMVLMAGMDLPVSAIREQISSAVNLIVQQTRFACGSRKVTHITEVSGIESGKILLQDIFVFRQDGIHPDGKIKGEFVACGFVPSFYEGLAKIGIDVDLSIFKERDSLE